MTPDQRSAVRRPSFVHYLLCDVLERWDRRVTARGFGTDLQRNNPIFLKPTVFLCADELRRSGFPLCIDVEFREPTSHPSLGLLESRTINRALAQCIERDWVSPPALGWPNYRLTGSGLDMLAGEAELARTYGAMARIAMEDGLAPLSEQGGGDDGEGRAGMDQVLDSVLTLVVGMAPQGFRSRLITQAMKVLLEGRDLPQYEFARSYHTAVQAQDPRRDRSRRSVPDVGSRSSRLGSTQFRR